MELNKKDLQLFLKRLRQNIAKDYKRSSRWTERKWYLKWRISPKRGKVSRRFKSHTNSKIRYFACGEYGSSTDRPHYHLLLFNVPLSYIQYDPIHREKYSKKLEEIWKQGKVDVIDMAHGTIHYTTKYHMYPLLLDWDQGDPRTKPFALQSKGIGKNYINDQVTDYYTRSQNCFATLKDGYRQSLGRYYKDKINEKIRSEETIREMQRRSRDYALEQEEIERSSYPTEAHYLLSKRQEFKNNTDKFKRQLKRNSKL